MAFDDPPYTIDGTTVDGKVIRRAIASLMTPGGGIVTPGGLAVTQQTSPNMSVQVGVGECWVPGTLSAAQGSYYGRNNAAVTVGIAAADPTNPRIDNVGVQVQDPEYSGSLTSMAAVVVTGTPTAGATLGNPLGLAALPASTLAIAHVLVPAGAASIVNADISGPLVGNPRPRNMQAGFNNAPTGTTTITHLMAGTPNAVTLGVCSSSGSTPTVYVQEGSLTSTTFQVINFGVSADFFWIAMI